MLRNAAITDFIFCYNTNQSFKQLNYKSHKKDLAPAPSSFYIGWILFQALTFTDAKLASGVPVLYDVSGPSRVQYRSFELALGAGSSARTINIKTSKKSCLTSRTALDIIFYRRLTVFQCYLSAIMHKLNNSFCTVKVTRVNRQIHVVGLSD